MRFNSLFPRKMECDLIVNRTHNTYWIFKGSMRDPLQSYTHSLEHCRVLNSLSNPMIFQESKLKILLFQT